MDIPNLELLVKNHPIAVFSSLAVGAYLLYSSVCLALIHRERKRGRKLKDKIIFYRNFIEQHPSLLEDSKVRKLYDKSAELVR
ncbi:hypothetical protein FJZ19_04640 [Candidatus Pacearchaeota archaeon]|nr:hypothetical protein [Candidatus Pacearchaeota archaeon]